ncbi:MAG TPA: MBL fold metallo-hydrolase [Gemmatimonadaceae bacterium]|nr:MBL fold metallo-hydrolase [Gemmatimonadaceae bacterium]
MIRIEHHGDVTRLQLSTWAGRSLGYTVSVYRVGDILIDSGFPRVASKLADWVMQAGIRGAIVTHWHEDHAGGASEFARRGLPIDLHPETERRLRTPPPMELYRLITWGPFRRLTSPILQHVPNGLEILPMPGHSPDHRVVWVPETRTLFAGDLFLGVKVRVAHDDEDFTLLLQSLRRCAALNPARMFCGHRGLVPNAASALTAKANWIEDMIGAIAQSVAAGRSDAQIVREVMGGEELTGRVSYGHYSRAAFVRRAQRALA